MHALVDDVDEGPDRGLGVRVGRNHPLRFAVELEGGETARQVVVGQELQVEVVELEAGRKLPQQLVHAVQEEQEDGRVAAGAYFGHLGGPMGEAIAEGQPLLVH